MKFKFPLQRVLDIRKTEERIRQNDLALERKKEADFVRKIESLRREQSEEYKRGHVFLSAATSDIRMFVAHQRYLEAMERTIARTCANLDGQRQAVEKARLALVEAARKRKLLEKLREKRLAAFKKEAEVAEQKIIDEVGSTSGRFARKEAQEGPG